jgi:hypothetical protein
VAWENLTHDVLVEFTEASYLDEQQWVYQNRREVQRAERRADRALAREEKASAQAAREKQERLQLASKRKRQGALHGTRNRLRRQKRAVQAILRGLVAARREKNLQRWPSELGRKGAVAANLGRYSRVSR